MAILGAHESIAGGYDKAVERAHQCGANCLQLFTKNNNQWAARDITSAEVKRFRGAMDTLGITHPIVHDSYLINLASPDPRLWQKSVDAFVVELHRAETLGIFYVVTHPGAFTTATEEAGLENIVRAIDETSSQTRDLKARCLLETTSGQGTTLGWRFEQLAWVFDRVKEPDRLGVCFDTCHVFAAGYPLGTPKDYNATMATFDRLLGVDRIKAFHLNDSRRERGSRIDRHEHIGRGQLGIEPFRLLLGDPRFRDVPMYLETPKGTEDGEDLDAVNLRTLRSCLEEQSM
jgi:deoxyribonuclease IV